MSNTTALIKSPPRPPRPPHDLRVDLMEYEQNIGWVTKHGNEFPWVPIEVFSTLDPTHRSVLVEASYPVEVLSANSMTDGPEWALLRRLFEQAAR
jgi:hypothetical protein